MNSRDTHRVGPFLAAALVVFFATTPPTVAIVQDFGTTGDPPAGMVLAGEEPLGGMADGDHFPDFILNVFNAGGGPQSLIIFDSSNPTGEDLDLGTPNETCDPPGPGQGQGGEQGELGENCEALNNLLIIAEDIEDLDSDNIVDDPDDEAGGGYITFDFDIPYVIDHVTIMDIDDETASVELRNDTLNVVVDATDLGDNSRQDLELASFGAVQHLKVTFSSSGAIGEVEYMLPPTPLEFKTWGQIKRTLKD